jgi:hypothetical protein
MKCKRLLLILACVAAILLAGYGTLRLTAPPHRITWESIERIQEGMSEANVECILGVPAGDYSSTEHGATFVLGEGGYRRQVVQGRDLLQGGAKVWVGDRGAVWLTFDASKRVSGIRIGLVESEESFLDKLRRWLGME